VRFGSDYQAVTACRRKGTKWYLPAKDELNVLYINRGTIGGLGTSNNPDAQWYWASSEYDNNHAQVHHFVNNTPYVSYKFHVHSVRCIRR